MCIYGKSPGCVHLAYERVLDFFRIVWFWFGFSNLYNRGGEFEVSITHRDTFMGSAL